MLCCDCPSQALPKGTPAQSITEQGWFHVGKVGHASSEHLLEEERVKKSLRSSSPLPRPGPPLVLQALATTTLFISSLADVGSLWGWSRLFLKLLSCSSQNKREASTFLTQNSMVFFFFFHVLKFLKWDGFSSWSVNKQGSSFLTHPTSTPTPTLQKKCVFNLFTLEWSCRKEESRYWKRPTLVDPNAAQRVPRAHASLIVYTSPQDVSQEPTFLPRPSLVPTYSSSVFFPRYGPKRYLLSRSSEADRLGAQPVSSLKYHSEQVLQEGSWKEGMDQELRLPHPGLPVCSSQAFPLQAGKERQRGIPAPAIVVVLEIEA